MEKTVLVTLRMPHFPDDLSVATGNTLNGMAGSIWIVLRIHAWLTSKVNVLAEDLPIITQSSKFLVRHYKFSFTVGNWDSVNVADLDTCQPR